MSSLIHRTSFAMLFVLGACGGLPDDRFDTVGADGRMLVEVKPDALKKLRWIAGSWRGVGEAGTEADPFFERYVFVDDTTLLVESFTDETFQTLKDRVPYVLRGDSIISPTSFAAKASADSITFSVRGLETTQLTWRRNRDSTWTSVATSIDGKGARDYWYYRMSRIKSTPAPKKEP